MMTEKMSQEMNGGWRVLFKVAMVLIPLIAAANAWGFTQIIALKEFAAHSEAQQFTLEQAVALEQRVSTKHDLLKDRSGTEFVGVWKEISRIREDVATIPRETPPAWLLERLDKLEASVERLHDAVERKE